MKDLTVLNPFRRRVAEAQLYGGNADSPRQGIFVLPSKIDGGSLRCLASSGEGWDHVSVSRVNRCPNWPEMCQIKDAFFEPDETVMQLHVPAKDHINIHRYCLHLWRPQGLDIPRPPNWMVGPKGGE